MSQEKSQKPPPACPPWLWVTMFLLFAVFVFFLGIDASFSLATQMIKGVGYLVGAVVKAASEGFAAGGR